MVRMGLCNNEVDILTNRAEEGLGATSNRRQKPTTREWADRPWKVLDSPFGAHKKEAVLRIDASQPKIQKQLPVMALIVVGNWIVSEENFFSDHKCILFEIDFKGETQFPYRNLGNFHSAQQQSYEKRGT